MVSKQRGAKGHRKQSNRSGCPKTAYSSERRAEIAAREMNNAKQYLAHQWYEPRMCGACNKWHVV